MVDPFEPVNATGTSLTPAQVPARGRSYYGLNGLGDGPDPFSSDGTGSIFDGTVTVVNPPGYTPPVFSQQGVSLPGGGINAIFADIAKLLPGIPAIISAAKSQPYYNPNQPTVYGRTSTALLPGQTYNADGSLSNVGANVGASLTNTFNSLAAFVATNPLIVLGGGAALFLLMREPPRRR